MGCQVGSISTSERATLPPRATLNGAARSICPCGPARRKITSRHAGSNTRFLPNCRAAMWHAVQELLEGDAEASGRLRVEVRATPFGSVRKVYINGRREVNGGLSDIPIVVLDATLSPEINQHFLPRTEAAVDLKQIAAPHETITQVIGLPVGKSALNPGERTPEEEERVARKRERIVNLAKWRAAGHRVAVITYKDAEQAFMGRVRHWPFRCD